MAYKHQDGAHLQRVQVRMSLALYSENMMIITYIQNIPYYITGMCIYYLLIKGVINKILLHILTFDILRRELTYI